VDPRTVDTYSEHAAEFAKQYESVTVLRHCELLLQHLPTGGKILEVGSGSGRDAAFLLAHGFDVTGTDASDALIAEAIKYHPQLARRLYNASVPFCAPYPFLADKFDGGVSMATIMHLSDEGLSIFAFQLNNLLKPGGILILSSSANRADLEDNRDPRGRLYHERSAVEITHLVSEEGFELLHAQTDDDEFGREVSWHGLVFKRNE